MDLLETILRSCDADKYLDNFKQNGMTTYALKILVEEDLLFIGIEDKETRLKILNHCKNLQIPTEKRRDLTVDNQFLSLQLSQINVQINKHYANLLYARSKNKVDLCYISVRPAALCLIDCLNSFEEQIEVLEKKILSKKASKRSRCPVLLFGTIAGTAFILYGFVKYVVK